MPRRKTGHGKPGIQNSSDTDFRLTRQINEAARVLHISFLDHVTVGRRGKQHAKTSPKNCVQIISKVSES
jgi:hypothetical protein